MSNILNELSDEIGFSCVTNQYIELMNRLFKDEHGKDDIDKLSERTGLRISGLPGPIDQRIAKQYIIGIQSAFEYFLIQFKNLAGTPTHGKDYSADRDGSRLKWTVDYSLKMLDAEEKSLLNICEYYRLVRNNIVHVSEKSTSELAIAYSRINDLNKMDCTKTYGHLTAPNKFDAINFDDQVLFARAALKLAKIIFQKSDYNWREVLEANGNYKEIWENRSDNKDKVKKKVVKKISLEYYIEDEAKLKTVIGSYLK